MKYSPTTIKIDVEGFECCVIKGLNKIIEQNKPAIITEVISDHLKHAGSSITELFEIMQSIGYRSFSMEIKRIGFRYHLSLREVKKPTVHMENNVLWLYPKSIHTNRLKIK